MADMTRRNFLGSAIGVSAAVLTGGTLLSACSEREAPSAAGNSSVPDHIPFTGVTPDFPALPNGTVAGFNSYPASPKSAYNGKPGDGKPVTGLAQLNGPLPPSVDSNQFWQELNNRTGSPMQIQLVNAGNDFIAKVATLQASDQLPDLMQLNPAVPSLSQFLRAKMLDLSPYLAGDKVKEYPFLANIPTQFWKACLYDGRLAGIPISRGSASSYVMFYRDDVVNKLGVKVDVTSYQTFSDLLTELTDARANRWGLAASPLDFIRQMYAIPNNFRRESNGSFVSAYEDPKQKEALEAARKLQAKGVINPDMAASTPAQRAQWFNSGTAVFNWSTYTGWLSVTGANKDARIGVLQVPGFDGGKGQGWAGNLTNNIVSIPASAKDRVKTLLKVVDWLSAPFGSAEYLFQRYGVEGVHYTLDGTNPKPITAKANELALGHNYLGSGPFVLFGPQDPTYAKGVHTHMSTYMDNAVLDPTQIYYSATYGSKGGKLGGAIRALELDIIYGRKPVSDWDAAVKDYLAGGGSEIKTELAQAAEKAPEK
jgi:putative aldouronate transport system substrate-binding protein